VNGWLVTTVGEEKMQNPRLQINGRSEYVLPMEQLDLPTPKLMTIAITANRACGELSR